MAQSGIGVSGFGTTADGHPVQKVTLGSGDFTAALLTYGAILQSVRLTGVPHDLTLGSDRIADYEGQMRYHGSLIGPVVNRIANAAATLDGRPLRFQANQDGRHCLHSGSTGSQHRHWRLAEATDVTCVMTLALPDGEGGFPGNRRITARWEVERPATLRLELTVTTDAPTFVNFANHSYWNLDGSDTWAGHKLRVAAPEVLRLTEALIPTGEILPVGGGPLDLRRGKLISPGSPALDTCFVLGRGREMLRDVLWLDGLSGVSMTVATTEPGIQVYDGRDAIRPGRRAFEGLAVEAQFWPDAPNHPAFPPIRLNPDEASVQVTEWRFRA
ncbi:MAG: hypothetical protein RIR62_1787 [Pseudomonadota bacterium]